MNLPIKVFGHNNSIKETSYEKIFYKVNYILRDCFDLVFNLKKGLYFL